jgi:hypothetical protein
MAPRKRYQNDSPSPSPRPGSIQKSLKQAKGQGARRTVSEPAALPTVSARQPDIPSTPTPNRTRRVHQVAQKTKHIEADTIYISSDDEPEASPMTEVSVDESVPSPATSACSSEVSLEEYSGDKGYHAHDDMLDHAEEEDQGQVKDEEETPETKPSEKPPTTPLPKNQTKSREDSPGLIDCSLEQMLRDPYKYIKRQKKTGFVYVFRHGKSEEALMKGDHRVKVGFSEDPETRARKIEWTCKRTIRHVLGDDMKPFETASWAEKLAQKELEHWRSDAPCDCGTHHREIFDTTEEHALAVRQRWVSFCKREPWDENGKLKPFWRDRLETRQQVGGDFEHDSEDRRWDKFTMPGEHEEQFYHAVAFLRSLVYILTRGMPRLLEFRGSAVGVLLAVKVWWTYGTLDVFPVVLGLAFADFVYYLFRDHDSPRKKSSRGLAL